MFLQSSIRFNAPVVSACFLVSTLILLMDWMTQGRISQTYFLCYAGSFADPFCWFRMVFHFLAYANIEQYLESLLVFLLIGPVLEEKIGSGKILLIILTTSALTGILNNFFWQSALQGMGSINFCFCILLAMSLWQKGTFPFSLLLFLIVLIALEVYSGLILKQPFSLVSHLGGALCAIPFGLAFRSSAA